MNKPIKSVAVVGLGSIGKRHLRNIKKIDPKSEVKTIFENKKTLEKRQITKKKKAENTIKMSNFNKEIEQIERKIKE